MNHLQIEGKRVCDFPSTVREVESASLETTAPLTHGGKPFETVGQALARLTGEAPPDGLPPEFVDQLAVAAADPETAIILGRICLHCIAAAQSEEAPSV